MDPGLRSHGSQSWVHFEGFRGGASQPAGDLMVQGPRADIRTMFAKHRYLARRGEKLKVWDFSRSYACLLGGRTWNWDSVTCRGGGLGGPGRPATGCRVLGVTLATAAQCEAGGQDTETHEASA